MTNFPVAMLIGAALAELLLMATHRPVFADARRYCVWIGACGAVSAGLLDRFTPCEARGFLDRTWEQLGLPRDDVVTAVREGREVHFLVA